MATGETARGADTFAAAHRQLVADGATQLDLPAFKVEPPPGWAISFGEWLRHFFEWLGHQGPVLKFIFWSGVAVILLLIVQALYPVVMRYIRRGSATEAEADAGWRPDAEPARQLLSEADALAAEGRFAEAAHLLLLRSVEQIAARRPGTLRPATTSRDIARAKALPRDVRGAFSLIAGVVEAGLFAGRAVGADAWTRCREAYEAVAFPKAWA